MCARIDLNCKASVNFLTDKTSMSSHGDSESMLHCWIASSAHNILQATNLDTRCSTIIFPAFQALFYVIEAFLSCLATKAASHSAIHHSQHPTQPPWPTQSPTHTHPHRLSLNHTQHPPQPHNYKSSPTNHSLVARRRHHTTKSRRHQLPPTTPTFPPRKRTRTPTCDPAQPTLPTPNPLRIPAPRHPIFQPNFSGNTTWNLPVQFSFQFSIHFFKQRFVT